MVEKSNYETHLGADLYKEAVTNFSLFVEADDQGSKTELTDAESIAALLLSLGVELDPPPQTLTLDSLCAILKEQVDNADPLDGICTELADKFDSEYSGECSREALFQFMDE